MPEKQSLCQFVPFYAKEAEFVPICPILSQRCRILTVFVLKRRSQFTSKIFTIYTKGNPNLHQRSRVLVSDSLCPHKNISIWTTLLQTNLCSCHGMVHHCILVHWEESVQRNKRQPLWVKWSRPSWWVVQNLEGEVWWHFGLTGTTWYPCDCACTCMCDLWVAQPYHGPMDSFAASGMLVKNSSLMNKYQYCTGLVSCTFIQDTVTELKPACS